MRTYLFLIFLLLMVSCGQSDEQDSREAIDIALTHLSDEKCDDAIKVLEESSDSGNPVYLQVLASAYACRAGYREISIISNDLANLDASSPEKTLSSIAAMSLSPESEADSLEYQSLRRAINILLDSTEGSPSQENRNKKFGSRKAGDMGIQALLLNVVTLGKFLNYYGNVNEVGKKGQGANSNLCFLNYTDSRARTLITSGAGGVCNSNNAGHPELDPQTSEGKRRLCEGLVMVTNTLDILDQLDVSGSDELKVLKDVSEQVKIFKEAAVAAGLTSLIDNTSARDCAASLDDPSNLSDMEFLYAVVFESGLQ